MDGASLVSSLTRLVNLQEGFCEYRTDFNFHPVQKGIVQFLIVSTLLQKIYFVLNLNIFNAQYKPRHNDAPAKYKRDTVSAPNQIYFFC